MIETGKVIKFNEEDVRGACDDWRHGMTVRDAAERHNMSPYYLYKFIRRLYCEDGRCDRSRCRAAVKRSTKMICTALDDADFGGRQCPFYKTPKAFQDEYRATNRLSYYELRALGYEQ